MLTVASRGVAGRIRVEQRFGMRRMIAEMEQIYHELAEVMAGPGEGRP